MNKILDYQIVQKLGESMQAEVFKARPHNKSEFVVVKKIKPRFCVKGIADYLAHQINQLSDLSLPHTILPEIVAQSGDSVVLQQPFIDALPLSDFLMESGQLDFASVLKTGIFLAERLEEIHKAGHIHKSIKPTNILIQPATGGLQIIDDIRILDINQISHFIYDSHFRSQTLPYLSPEQTGRIKYTVNYSTDLYSLGMVLYACLTGSPPFLFADPIAIIHSHLAEMPALLHKIKPDVPKQLSKIISLLLEKAPEKRYQTASGLAADLKQCLEQWQSSHKLNSFTLKQKDFSNRITIPSVMVGREEQKQQMLSEFNKVCSGVFRAALISGLSGIGKTRLIQELQLPIVKHSGYFTSGKFDQFKKHIPYSTLIQAFSTLIKTFLSEDSERIDYWRERISSQLGDNGRLMIDLVPELELIIGAQPDVSDLPPVEARNRFNDTIGRFIACLANQEHPLTLFIDDLQWCDGATFDVLESLFDNAADYPWLFWVGAYRDNEVDASHRLTRLVQRVKQFHRPLLEIRLHALGLREVNLMTAYILNTYPTRTEALAEIIFQTSAGNPLFVNESLRWLHYYRHLHLSEDGTWKWDDEQLRHTSIPDSALDLFKDKIGKLSGQLRELLMIAASLGARFQSDELALVANMTLPNLYQVLSEAFTHNILLREKNQLFFFHDQVQAAVESFMDDDKKRNIHERIAQAFIETISEHSDWETLPHLFAIVEHLDEGRPENPSSARLRQEALFNYAAGKAAMKALAMDNANFFFSQCRRLYPEPSWDRDYDFLFSLHKFLARTEMALGNQPASEAILNTLINQAKNDLDRVDCLYEQTTGLSSMGKFKEAIELGNRGLKYFERDIPDDDGLALDRAKIILSQIHQGHSDVWQKILDITPAGDRATRIETGIYSELIPDYYLAGMVPQLYLSAIQSTQNCLAGGVDETVIYGFSMVGLYLQRQDQFEMSFRYEDLGLALSERYPDTFGATKGINGILWTNMHNRRSSDHIIKQCQQNIHRGKNCGDLYNAGLSYGPYLWHLIHQGVDLKQAITVAEECKRFSKKFNLSLSLGLAESVLAGWVDEMNAGRRKLTEAQIEAKLYQWEQAKHVVSIGCYYTLKGISNHYLGGYRRAADYLEKAEPYLRGLSDNILNRLWYVFRFVNGLRLHKEPDHKEQEKLAECLDRVQIWASLGPVLKPYLMFMVMEQAYHAGNFSETRRYCLDAIDQAKAQNFILLEAFIHERLGQLLIERQHEHANYHLIQAVKSYRQCGAEVKAAQLLSLYSFSVADERELNEQSLAQMLDVEYLVQATRSITQQLDFKPLLETIVQSVMARLGAKTGYLLIADKRQLTVLAKGEKHDQVDVEIRDKTDLNAVNLSMAIVNYVYRTADMVVLNNACEEGDFKTDEVVQRMQLKSILCLPLLMQQKTLGVLYLENSLIKSVFTLEDIELTRLLTAQAAIALQNTLLIEQMKKSQQQVKQLNKNLELRVAERTEALNKANEELKNFAYVVSHDLKAPLRAINQLSSWIADDYASAFDAAGKEQIELLQSRARRMHDMIEGILQYSRVGRIKEPNEKIDINKLLEDVIKLIAPPDNFEIRIQEHMPVITGEAITMFQVFQNLLDNAIKYNDKAKGKVEIACTENGEFWRFSFKDNGPGIPKQYQEKVFQLFQTLTPKDQSGSTGIGLSLIEKIVDHWGGKIWLVSEPKQGCEFIFTVPKTYNNNYERNTTHITGGR
ncbi:MAG: AAA family ATPase [Gammaproteobacteria bacterium]